MNTFVRIIGNYEFQLSIGKPIGIAVVEVSLIPKLP